MRNYTKDDIKSCNDSQKEQQLGLDIKFIKHAVTFQIDECQGAIFFIILHVYMNVLKLYFYHNILLVMFFFISGPCKYIKYEAQTLSYDAHSTISIIPGRESALKQSNENGIKKNSENEKNRSKDIGDTKEVMFYYSTTQIKVMSEDKIINFSNFISAVGGNLGLFIGFSFLGFFSSFYNVIKRLCNEVQPI